MENKDLYDIDADLWLMSHDEGERSVALDAIAGLKSVESIHRLKEHLFRERDAWVFVLNLTLLFEANGLTPAIIGELTTSSIEPQCRLCCWLFMSEKKIECSFNEPWELITMEQVWYVRVAICWYFASVFQLRPPSDIVNGISKDIDKHNYYPDYEVNAIDGHRIVFDRKVAIEWLNKLTSWDS